MKKSLLFVLGIPLLLVGCKANNSGGNGNGGGGNITPPGGDSIKPTEIVQAFKDACADQELGFEITVKDVESESDECYMTYGLAPISSTSYSYYFIQSKNIGTGWEHSTYQAWCDDYINGDYRSTVYLNNGESSDLGQTNTAVQMSALMAYVGQDAVSATATKTSALLLSHECDKYTITTYGDTVNYYISKSFGFTLQCDYDIQGEGTGYVYKLEGITTLGNPVFMALT